MRTPIPIIKDNVSFISLNIGVRTANRFIYFYRGWFWDDYSSTIFGIDLRRKKHENPYYELTIDPVQNLEALPNRIMDVLLSQGHTNLHYMTFVNNMKTVLVPQRLKNMPWHKAVSFVILHVLPKTMDPIISI